MLSKEKLLDMFKKMCLIRNHEELVQNWKLEGKIHGSMHIMRGQEAVAVGACAALQDTDYITSTHRGHGHFIAKGTDIQKLANEMCGRVSGYNRGKGGHMLIADREVFALGGCGIVAGALAVATGYAMAFKLKKTGQIALAFFGDGATGTGAFHETLNFASVRQYPVVFVCENNRYALSCPAERGLSNQDITERAKSYNIPAVKVDGNNVLEVYKEVKKAVDYSRSNLNPYFVEAVTYRMCGLGVGDPMNYMPREYWEQGETNDPIEKMKDYLVKNGLATIEDIEVFFDEAKNEIENYYENALKEPYPDSNVLFENIYAGD